MVELIIQIMEGKNYIHVDFNNYKTEEDVINMILKRKSELKAQGYNSKQVFEIIFEDSRFKNNFLSEKDYLKIMIKLK